MVVERARRCAECGREFVASASNTRYCSDECRGAANKRNKARAKQRAKERMERDRHRQCPWCQHMFVRPYRSDQIYCSTECRDKARARDLADILAQAKADGVPSVRAVRKGYARDVTVDWAKDAPKLTQEERDERCIAFLAKRAKNVPCTECRCRVLEGEWMGPGGDNPSGASTYDVHVRVRCDKGLEPMVGCPGFECGYPQRRVREFRRKGRGFGTQMVEVNRLTSLLEIDG